MEWPPPEYARRAPRDSLAVAALSRFFVAASALSDTGFLDSDLSFGAGLPGVFIAPESNFNVRSAFTGMLVLNLFLFILQILTLTNN